MEIAAAFLIFIRGEGSVENYHKEYQAHFLKCLLDGRNEISEGEAATRSAQLGLKKIGFPCFVACIAPDLSQVKPEKKNEIIFSFPDYVVRFFSKKGISCYAVLNSYDYIQVLITQVKGVVSDDMFVELHEKFLVDYGYQQFIGIGSEVNKFSRIAESSSEAFSMLAYKNQYADRGVINIKNIIHFRYNLSYSNDEVYNRVIGCFQDGNLAKMSVRLDELVHEIRYRPRVSGTSIKRTMIELTVHILHIASNANVDVDQVLNGEDPYNWIMMQQETPPITSWFLNLASKLLEEMQKSQESQKKSTIQVACNHIVGRLSDPDLGLQSLSEWVGLSPSYLSQLFKTETGLGVSSYITKQRIEYAKELLQTTQLKVEEIAFQLGYTRSNYFGMVFKKETGMTPGSYRRMMIHADSK